MVKIIPRLLAIIARLRQAVATHVAAQARPPIVVWLGTRVFMEAPPPPRVPALPAATWNLLCARLERLAERIQSLFARWQAGALPRPRAPRPATGRARKPYVRLPAARGWINARVAPAASCAGNLRTLLQEPDVARFAAQVPQAGRLLRPLCRALALDLPSWLRLPPRPRRPRPRPAPPPVATPEPGTPDRPLQPYIRAAARAWRHRPA